jgi:hypothetical protein
MRDGLSMQATDEYAGDRRDSAGINTPRAFHFLVTRSSKRLFGKPK